MGRKEASKRTEKPGDAEANEEETWTRLEESEDNVKRLRTALYVAHNKRGPGCLCADCETVRHGDEFIAADVYYNRLFDKREAT